MKLFNGVINKSEQFPYKWDLFYYEWVALGRLDFSFTRFIDLCYSLILMTLLLFKNNYDIIKVFGIIYGYASTQKLDKRFIPEINVYLV